VKMEEEREEEEEEEEEEGQGEDQEKMKRGCRDFQVLGMRRWGELVADRKKWKDIVRQAKAHSGL